MMLGLSLLLNLVNAFVDIDEENERILKPDGGLFFTFRQPTSMQIDFIHRTRGNDLVTLIWRS